jgi:uncharacterized membrane protein
MDLILIILILILLFGGGFGYSRWGYGGGIGIGGILLIVLVVYLLVTHRLRRPAMDETGAELIVSGTAPSAQRSGFAWCEKPVC